MIKDIINGHIKELLNDNEILSKKRLLICEKCLLYRKSIVGPICDSNKWISLDGSNVSEYKEEGYVRGCNCRLDSKTRLDNSKCIINKW